MDVKEWMSYECTDEGTYCMLRTFMITHLLVHLLHPHASEEENRTRNRSKNCKYKPNPAFLARGPLCAGLLINHKIVRSVKVSYK
jgi:hypothetical protein